MLNSNRNTASLDQREERLDEIKEGFLKDGFWTSGILQDRTIERFNMLNPLRKGKNNPKGDSAIASAATVTTSLCDKAISPS